MRPGTLPPAARASLLWYGDDFTGATDTLGTAARAGLRALLFLKPPSDAELAAAGELDCVGVAGAARSMAPAEMRAELAPIGPLFRRLGARVLHYKLCSTFDSVPEVGNVGVALSALRDGLTALPDATAAPLRTALIGGQPDLGRYCAFGNLFARAGSAGEVYRIDRHPTMSRHPVTPMGEADLRQHLARQGLPQLGLIPWTTLRAAGPHLREQWQAMAASAADGVLFDVLENTDLERIGDLLWPDSLQGPLLVAGASSVVQAFAPRLRPRRSQPDIAAVAAARGPVFVLAGSLSPVTAEQVRAASSFEKIWLDAQALLSEPDYRQSAIQRICALLQTGRHVLAGTVPPGLDRPQPIDARELARAGGTVLAGVLARVPLGRVAVAGGDTSSHAVQALPVWGLSYAGAVSPGVALCRLHSHQAGFDGIEIALKGGQMGTPDFFERLIHGVLP